jgi:hypothetical protein
MGRVAFWILWLHEGHEPFGRRWAEWICLLFFFCPTPSSVELHSSYLASSLPRSGISGKYVRKPGKTAVNTQLLQPAPSTCPWICTMHSDGPRANFPLCSSPTERKSQCQANTSAALGSQRGMKGNWVRSLQRIQENNRIWYDWSLATLIHHRFIIHNS